MKKIVWIASYPKSGNTWVRSILANAIFQESDIVKFSQLIPSLPALNHALHQRKNEIRDYGEVMRALEKTQKVIAENSNNSRCMVKTHTACGSINGINFPALQYTAAVVYLVRDPRDVLISWAAHMDKSLEETESVMLDSNFRIAEPGQPMNREFLSSWENHVMGWQKFAISPLIVKYEDLVFDTERCIYQILGHLDIDARGRIDEILFKTSFGELQRQEKNAGFSERRGSEMFFRRGKVGSWQNSNFDFSRISKKFKQTMIAFNYL
jgi:hypothetical protein